MDELRTKFFYELVPEFNARTGADKNFHALFMLLKDKNIKRVDSRESYRFFNKPMMMFMILYSDDVVLRRYIELVKKYHVKNKLLIDYQEFRKYRQYCSCANCFPPCVRLAYKENIFKNLVWKDFLKDYDYDWQ